MNTATNEQFHGEGHGDESRLDDTPGLSLAGEIVEVRRNAAVAAVVGILASGVAIAWFGRAISTGSVGDWVVVAFMGGLATLWLATCVDARTPLMVADDQGVRLRLGRAWVGLPWSAVERVEHRPRRGLLRDGVLNVVPHNPDRLLAEVGPAAARHAGMARRLHGGPLALPLGLGTRVVGGGEDLTAGLDRLATRGAEVVVVGEVPGPEDELAADTLDADHSTDHSFDPRDPSTSVDDFGVLDPDVTVTSSETEQADLDEEPDEDAAPVRRPALLSRARLGVTALVAGRRRTPSPEEADDTVDAVLEADEVEVEPSDTPAPVRSIVAPSRSEAVSSLSTPLSDETEVLDSADVELFEEDQPWGERVSPIAREGQPVAPVVVDDFVVEPAQDPVVGPELRAARTRLGLTTDQLAERTRIRPHVIEAIEVDDFVPCGGDFYARGHLRTLARVLGIDVAPLLVSYDERYANAPIDPRRVFEAELATGSHGSIRGTKGGPNWSILVAVVMALVLAWSVARLVMDSPQDTANTPVLNGSGGPGGVGNSLADPVKVRVVAPKSGAEVVVRDAAGSIVFQGNLAIGETAEVKASAPVRVQSSDGSVTVSVAGKQRGAVGEAGEPAQGTYAD